MKKLSILIFSCITIFALPSSAQMKYANNAINVAIVVYDGVETLDFAGPGEVFSDASNDSGMLCNVYTVASTSNQISSNGFLKLQPDYSISNAPKPDVIVIPGGDSRNAMKDQPLIDWIKSYENSGCHYISVCTGAFLLAQTGLLDGKTATTHYCCQDRLAEKFKNVKVVRNERFVDNGTVITTEGISAGIDGSLYLVQKFFGNQIAVDDSHYMMYDWHPDSLPKIVTE